MRLLYKAGNILISAAVVIAPLAASAQNAPRNMLGIKPVPIKSTVPANRPSFSDTTAFVPVGHFEAEGGFEYDHNQGGGDSYTLGSGLLLRTGITHNVELLVGNGGYMLNAPGNDGLGNTTIGAKFRVHNQTRYTPTVAVRPQITLPLGDGQLVSNKVEPGVHFIWAKSLSQRFSLGGNVNFAENTESDGDYHFQTAVSIAGGYAVNSRLSAYAEYYSIIPTGPDRTSDAIDGGVAYLTSRRTQLDAFIGSGLHNSTSDPYIGFGIAHLW